MIRVAPTLLLMSVLVSLATVASDTFATLAPDAFASRVDNFVLLDHQGDAHELYYHRATEAVVLMVQGNNCPSTGKSVASYKGLRDHFEPLGVKFFMLNSNMADQRPDIAQEALKYGIDMPILPPPSRV